MLFLLFAAILACCFLLLGVNIFFRKNGKFPETEIGRNEALRKRGLMCAKEEEMRRWQKNDGSNQSPCAGCAALDICKLPKT